MITFCRLGLVLALGSFGPTLLAQYPSGGADFGPSSFPMRAPGQSLFDGVPQVPQGYNAQQVPQQGLVGTHDAVYQLAATQQGYQDPTAENVAPPVPRDGLSYSGSPSAHSAPAHSAPMQSGAMQSGPSGSAPGYYPGHSAASPWPSVYSGFNPLAPNCVSCGPAPISQPVNNGAIVASETGHRFFGMPDQAKAWFFGAGGLIFNRIDDKAVPLSFFDSGYFPDELTTRDARQGATGGFEATIGRYFNCGRNAIALTYWGLYPEDEVALRERTMSGDYRSRIPFQYLDMSGTPSDPGMPYSVYDWYDNAYTHSLRRDFAYHNVEVNLLGFAAGGAARRFACPVKHSLFGRAPGCGDCGGAGCDNCATSCSSCTSSKFTTGPCCLIPSACGSRLNLTWIAGFRYFRFDDGLLFAASLDDPYVTRDTDDLYYEVSTTNNLYGFQSGCRFDYCVGQRLNLYNVAKVGVYNNRSTMFTSVGTDFDTAYLNDTRMPANPDNGMAYRFDESKDNIAFLSEIGSGFGYRLTCNWTATFGYRAVIASGVATAPGNVQKTFANYEEIRDYDVYDTLVLHGFNFGAQCNY